MESKTYKELKESKDLTGEYFSYSEKLQSLEWKKKRDLIVKRDGNKCTNCGVSKSEFISGIWRRDPNLKEMEQQKKDYIENVASKRRFYRADRVISIPYTMIKLDRQIILHVHHKYYIKDFLPWEYNNDALVTLCQNCHQDVHDKEVIPVYLNELKVEKCNLNVCDRCNGSGYLKQYHYCQSGICFKCKGNLFLEEI